MLKHGEKIAKTLKAGLSVPVHDLLRTVAKHVHISVFSFIYSIPSYIGCSEHITFYVHVNEKHSTYDLKFTQFFKFLFSKSNET